MTNTNKEVVAGAIKEALDEYNQDKINAFKEAIKGKLALIEEKKELIDALKKSIDDLSLQINSMKPEDLSL